MNTAAIVLAIAAIAAFLLASVAVVRVNLIALGLALFSASFLAAFWFNLPAHRW